MAQVVLALGTSHGPTIQSEPEKWRLLGERDSHDPRMDYQALLKAARPGLDREIGIEVQRGRHAAARAGLAKMSTMIERAKLDVIVVVSNLHRVGKTDPHPVFGILRAERFAVTTLSQQLFDPEAKHLKEGNRAADKIVDVRPGHPALANHLLDGLIQEEGFDVACADALPEGAALDDAYSFLYEHLLTGRTIPMVPIMLSRNLPNQATAARCHDFGLALRRQIERWPAAARVGLIASGGLSHQVIDEELDRMVVKALAEGDTATLRSLPRDRLNRAPGTPEILNWVCVGAAMAPSPMQLIEYLPCYRSLAGTGHGVGLGCWT